MATNLSFQKIATVPASGLVVGRIYFETSTGMIKVATSATAVDKFGDGVKSASWDESAKTLKIINESGEEISLNLSDVASASAVTTELAKKLNIGAASDASSVQSYYGLKKYTDEKVAAIPAAITYKGDGTTITQSGKDTVTFAVGAIAQSKVTGLETALAGKAAASHTHTKADITDFDNDDYATAAQGTKADTALQSVTATGAGNLTLTAAAKSGTTQAISGSLTTSTVASNGAGLVIASDVKKYVDDQVAAAQVSALKYKGSCTYAELPEDAVEGDVWNVTDKHDNVPAGTNYAWDGEAWDPLAGSVDLSPYLTISNAASTYATQSELTSGLAGKADAEHTHEIAEVTGLQVALDGKVPTSRTINGKPLTNNVTLAAGDVGAAPTIHTHTIANVTGLQDTLDAKADASTLSGYVPTSRKVNGQALGADVTLAGEHILVGGDSTYRENNIQEAIEAIDSRITAAAASGVQSFGGKTGAITLKATSSTNGAVNLTMSNNELQAAVVGLKSAAYSDAGTFATKVQGDKADTAIQVVNGTEPNYITASKNGTTVTVSSIIQAVAGASSSAKGLAEASDVKAYVDSTVNSALTWAEFE